MTTLENFVSPALTRALGWTLLHSLWQGALVAAVLAGALLLLRRQRAEVRYAVSVGALGVVVVLAGITFGLYFKAGVSQDGLLNAGSGQAGSALPLHQAVAPATEISTVAAGAAGVAAGATTGAVAGRIGWRAETGAKPESASISARMMVETRKDSMVSALRRSLATGLRYFDQHLPLLVVAWLLGLLAMSLRMLGGLLYVQRLRRYRVRPLSAAWQERLAALAARSGVRRPVALLESALVQVPLVVGHLRPVILLPLGVVAGLSPAYLEAILAHELAHVLRRDYLVNLLQTVAEVLFFYHPAVWFVAGCVRAERENCCDDTATALVGGDPLRLARALTALAEWTQSAVVPVAPRLALAAIGKRGELLNRVRRLVQRRPAAPTLAEGIMAGALVLGGLGLLGSSVVLARPLAQPVLPAAFDWQTGPAVSPAPVPVDTTKRVAKTAAITTTTTGPAPILAVPDQPGNVRREGAVTQEGPDSDGPGDRRHSRQDRENRREMAPRPFPDGPGTVVITKDKKGRFTNLVVNGQPVEAATAKASKADRRAGRQVTVATLPPAQPDWNFNVDYLWSVDDKMAKSMDKRARDFDRKMDRKMERNMDKAAQKIGKFGGPYVYVTPRNGRRSDGDNIRIEINDEALNHLANNALALGNIGLNIGLQAAAQGLEEARRGLEATLRNPNLDGETRRATKQALSELKRDQANEDSRRPEAPERPEARERAEDLRNRRQELQERIRESQQELRDLEQDRADRDRDRADLGRDLVDRNRDRADHNRDHDEALAAKMQQDGLIKDKDHYQVKLTAHSLMIDGKEQPPKVLQKYRQLYEKSNGRQLTGGNAVVITRNRDSSTINNGGPNLPEPPQPPRAPRAPRLAPLGPPAPPRPPRAPAADTETLRDELRKDGVIGRNEKDFQFQLSNLGLTVNGKKQSDDLAAKYRKLTGHDGGKTFNMAISTQE